MKLSDALCYQLYDALVETQRAYNIVFAEDTGTKLVTVNKFNKAGIDMEAVFIIDVPIPDLLGFGVNREEKIKLISITAEYNDQVFRSEYKFSTVVTWNDVRTWRVLPRARGFLDIRHISSNMDQTTMEDALMVLKICRP